MTEIPQDAALRLYLAMIAGDAPRSQFFEVRWKRSGGGMGQDFVPLAEPERAARMIRNRGQLTDTYVGAAPRTERRGGLDAVPRVHCLWVDCDSRESVQQLAQFSPLPSLVIRSGTEGHAHAYWPLADSVPAGWAKRGNQRLALALVADRAATDAARILRPPCTLSHKHDPPAQVLCTRLELDAFTFADVVAGLPDVGDYQLRRAPRLDPPANASQIVEGLARTVREAQRGNRNSALHWAACRLAEREFGDGAVEALREAAIDVGLPEPEIDRTLRSALERSAAA